MQEFAMNTHLASILVNILPTWYVQFDLAGAWQEFETELKNAAEDSTKSLPEDEARKR